MVATSEGGKKAAITNKAKYGDNFYSEIGRRGGKNGHTGGFGSDKVGADGLTGKQRARVAGSKGGAISKRGKAKSKEQIKLEHMPLIEQKRIAEQKKSAEQKKTFLQKLFGKK